MKVSEDETTDHSLYQTPVQAWPMLANTDASEGAVPGSTSGLQLQVQNQGLREARDSTIEGVVCRVSACRIR